MNKRGFASDNNAGVHPDILEAINKANHGHTIAYGEDEYSVQAVKKMKKLFSEQAEIYFVFIGTAANVLSINALTQSYNSVICAETAHIQVDECGAPEKFTGCKLLPVETTDGKLTPDTIAKHVHGFGFEHHSQPKVISITQATELGTVYSIDEIKAITAYAHQHNMLVHMDGARISNAAASLNCTFGEMTTEAGIDVVSFGGTKNGMMYGEAVIFLNKDLAENFKYQRKQAMQLASKMRFISTQFIAYLENDLWRKNAEHANKMARLLSEEVDRIPEIKLTQKTDANGVFAIVPAKIIPDLQNEYFFYLWDEKRSEVRWMTSYDTTEEDIRNFVSLLKSLLNK